jgi:hypothetical protein
MLADIHCDCRGLAYFAGDVKVNELSAFVLHFDRFVGRRRGGLGCGFVGGRCRRRQCCDSLNFDCRLALVVWR